MDNIIKFPTGALHSSYWATYMQFLGIFLWMCVLFLYKYVNNFNKSSCPPYKIFLAIPY